MNLWERGDNANPLTDRNAELQAASTQTEGWLELVLLLQEARGPV